MHHFVDDKSLHYSSKSLKDINQEIKLELKNILHWLRANKVSLNTKKTKRVRFRTQKTIIKKNKYFRMSGQKINMIKETKNVGMVMNAHLTFKSQKIVY